MNFMDFCSGIGGGRLGLEKNNLKCVAHSEIENSVINWFKQNKTLILNDIIKGRGRFSAEWVLVAQRRQQTVDGY